MASIKKNFAYQTMWQILSMILPLVTSPLLSRSLGAEGIGIYSFVSSVVGYFILVAHFGVYKYGTQKIAASGNDQKNYNRVFCEIWWLHVILSMAVGCFYILFIINNTDYRIFYVIMGLQYVGKILSIDWLFAGLEDFKKITIRDTIIKIVTFILIIFFIRDRNDLLIYFLITALGGLASGISLWSTALHYVHFVTVTVEGIFSHTKGMMFFFIPALIENVYFYMDKIMLGIADSKISVGFYENAEKALIARRVINALIAVLMPRMTFLFHNHKKEEINQLSKKAIDYVMILAVACGFGTAAISKKFAVIFWGEEFYPSAQLIVIMAVALPIMGLSDMIREDFLLPSQQNKKFIVCASLGAVINFLINFFLIPVYGVIIAAISTVVAESMVLLAQCIVIRNQFPVIQYIKKGCIYIPFGIIMFFMVRSVGSILGVHIYALLLEIMVGMLVYVGLCSIYWKYTGQTYYFNICKKLIRKFIRVK